MTSRLFTGFVSVGFALIALQAQSGPDLSGIWKANPEKSKFAGRAPDNYRIKIEQQGQQLTVLSRQGPNAMSQTAKYLLSGDTTGEGFGNPKIHTEWNGGAFVVTTTATGRNGQITTTQQYTLSDDKKTLTLSRKTQQGDQTREDLYVMERQPDSAWEPESMAETAFKNIKVLQGIPANRVQPMMRTFTQGLGVECNFCHVQGDNSKDDKPAKETARHMIQMAASINKTNFSGNDMVTCYTCHRGSAMPESKPKPQQ